MSLADALPQQVSADTLYEAFVEWTAERADEIEQGGAPADLVPTFALPIPSLVICELLGVPYADRDGFQALSTARFDLGVAAVDGKIYAIGGYNESGYTGATARPGTPNAASITSIASRSSHVCAPMRVPTMRALRKYSSLWIAIR